MTTSADTQITDLTVNDHACLTFGEPEELFDLTAAFVRDGLDGGLKVVWLSDATPDRATAELARRGIVVAEALASGQQQVSVTPNARMILAGLPAHLQSHLRQAQLEDRFTLADSPPTAAGKLSEA